MEDRICAAQDCLKVSGGLNRLNTSQEIDFARNYEPVFSLDHSGRHVRIKTRYKTWELFFNNLCYYGIHLTDAEIKLKIQSLDVKYEKISYSYYHILKSSRPDAPRKSIVDLCHENNFSTRVFKEIHRYKIGTSESIPEYAIDSGSRNPTLQPAEFLLKELKALITYRKIDSSVNKNVGEGGTTNVPASGVCAGDGACDNDVANAPDSGPSSDCRCKADAVSCIDQDDRDNGTPADNDSNSEATSDDEDVDTSDDEECSSSSISSSSADSNDVNEDEDEVDSSEEDAKMRKRNAPDGMEGKVVNVLIQQKRDWKKLRQFAVRHKQRIKLKEERFERRGEPVKFLRKLKRRWESIRCQSDVEKNGILRKEEMIYTKRRERRKELRTEKEELERNHYSAMKHLRRLRDDLRSKENQKTFPGLFLSDDEDNAFDEDVEDADVSTDFLDDCK